MIFCGGWDQDSARYVATVSGVFLLCNSFRTLFQISVIDDKMLMVWDLHPAAGIESSPPPSAISLSLSPSPSSRPQPTAYVISFPHPLTSIRSHPSISKEFLVSDCHGAVYLTDWRSDPDEGDPGALRHSSLVELIEPSALSVSCMGGPSQQSASVDWRSDAVDLQVPYYDFRKQYLISTVHRIGGVYGQKFSLWDMSKLRGGTPSVSGNSFAEGGHIFRYVFATSCNFIFNNSTNAGGARLTLSTLQYPINRLVGVL